MKYMKLLSMLLFVLALWGAANKAQSREWVIGVSPYLSEAGHKATAQTLIEFLSGMEAGDEAVIIDAYNLKTLGTFVVPDDKRYTHPKARIAKNRPVVGALLTLPKSAQTDGVKPAVEGAIRLPQFLRHVTDNYRREEQLDVIVLGSPFYDTPDDQEVSMADGLVPGDGHIKASRQKTLYGTADTPLALKNASIHFGLVGSRKMQSDIHDYYVERFWTLYIAAMRGNLSSFSADLKALFTNVKEGRKPPANDYKLEDTERLEMIRVRKIEFETSIYERPLSTTKLSAQRLRRAPRVEVGLSWDCPKCDMDLYARPFADATTLSYKHTRSTEGIYFKDFQQSPQSTNGFETIEFVVPVDLSTLQIAVNFYAGDAASGVNGELRISVDGHTYAQDFHISAVEGNSGAFVEQSLNQMYSNVSQIHLFEPLTIVSH